jgi:hypothetical protein
MGLCTPNRKHSLDASVPVRLLADSQFRLIGRQSFRRSVNVRSSCTHSYERVSSTVPTQQPQRHVQRRRSIGHERQEIISFSATTLEILVAS